MKYEMKFGMERGRKEGQAAMDPGVDDGEVPARPPNLQGTLLPPKLKHNRPLKLYYL